MSKSCGGGFKSFECSETSMAAIHLVNRSRFSNEMVFPKYGRSLFLSTFSSLLMNVKLKWKGACRLGSQPKYHHISSIGQELTSLKLSFAPSLGFVQTILALLKYI